MPRYRFHDFVLSPRRRTLVRGERELPLIPRYFDLLVFLVERRHQAVHRRDIFDHVWRDVVVSDSALSQAIRTIRRVLDDDSREPRYVRTVSRHGYRFVFEEVIEEDEEEISPTLRPSEGVSTEESNRETVPHGTLQGDTSEAGKIVLPGGEYARWVGAVSGAAAAGLAAGGIGALLLASVPDSRASFQVVPVLTLLGGGLGAIGAAGVSGGLSLAESRLASLRAPGAVLGAAAGGGTAGLLVQLFGGWTLDTVAGVHVPVGGLIQGLAIGAACGVAFVSRNRRKGPASTAAAFASLCGLAALAIVLSGLPLVGGTLHAIAEASAGAQTTLAPLGRLLGEQDFGPLTAALMGSGEGVLFGAGFGLGLSRRS